MRIMFQPLTLTIALACISACFAEDLKTKYEWKYIDYDWKDDAQKKAATDEGVYDVEKIVPTDYQLLPDGTELLVTPKLLADNPASLSTITKKVGDGGPLLSPYPDWSWHSSSDCSKIISVSRVILDDYNRLWAVDSGKVGDKQVCPAKIIQFDVTTSELVFQLEIPSEISHSPEDANRGRLEGQYLDCVTKDQCYYWIVDIDGYGLIIYDGTDIWRLDGSVFYPTDEGQKFITAGENYTMNWGPTGVNIMPKGFVKGKWAMIKVLASLETGFMNVADVYASKDGSIVPVWKANIVIATQEPAKVWTKEGGILFAAFNAQTAIGCWNSRTPLFLDNTKVVARDEERLQFITSFKITAGAEEGVEILSMVSTRLQKHLLGEVNSEEINYRVLDVDAHKLVAGTICDSAPHEVMESMEEMNMFPYKTVSKITS